MWDGIFKPAFIEGAVTAAVWGSAFFIAFILRRLLKSDFVRRPRRMGGYYESRLSEILLSFCILSVIGVIFFLIYASDTNRSSDKYGKMIMMTLGFIALFSAYYCLNYKILWNEKEILVKTIFGVRKRITWDAVDGSNLNNAEGFYVQQGRVKISASVYNLGHKYLWRYARCRLKNVPHVRSY